MALWVCRRCGCKFAVGLAMCPQCTGTDVEADDMPKITVSGGPSNAGDPGGVGYHLARPEVEEETSQAADGTDSSIPTDSDETPSSEETTSKRKSARMTANPSKRGRRGSSSARSTDTGQEDE